jgi:hypothetical protein
VSTIGESIAPAQDSLRANKQSVRLAANAHVNTNGAHDSDHATRTRLVTPYAETSDA